ncbi:GL18330 [Drosophila persimilis]|uniref:GL18330 n=1 Tax=Drosophila persimilis TaxID=7234 RepID=B4H4G9_DROPE|nr:GL18330 [Drosophila persimilis]
MAILWCGYPESLLTTDQLSTIQRSDWDEIVAKRAGSTRPLFYGCSFRPGWWNSNQRGCSNGKMARAPRERGDLRPEAKDEQKIAPKPATGEHSCVECCCSSGGYPRLMRCHGDKEDQARNHDHRARVAE